MARQIAVIEVYPERRNKKKPVYRWRKVGANGVPVCFSADTFSLRRYAAVAARRELKTRIEKVKSTFPVVHKHVVE